AVLLVSSLLCFFFEHSWWADESWNWVQKIPVYSLLGVSSSFVLIFSVLDLINLVLGIIRSEAQIYLLAVASAIAGLLFGAIFAVVDVEDAQTPIEMQKALATSEAFCYPVGLALGVLGGRINMV